MKACMKCPKCGGTAEHIIATKVGENYWIAAYHIVDSDLILHECVLSGDEMFDRLPALIKNKSGDIPWKSYL